MNIYHIAWIQNKCFELNAVVIANGGDEALKTLDLDLSFNSKVQLNLIGTYISYRIAPAVICQEQL